MVNQELENRVLRLSEKCHTKREELHNLAIKSGRRKGSLSVVAGILSVLSGLMVSYSVISSFPYDVLNWVGIGLSFISGTIAIFIGNALKDKEVSNILSGANDFLELREEVRNLGLIADIVTKQEKYLILQERYIRSSGTYDQYLPQEANK